MGREKTHRFHIISKIVFRYTSYITNFYNLLNHMEIILHFETSVVLQITVIDLFVSFHLCL